MPDYKLAARLIAQVQRAGARHSVKDTEMIQQVHDMACELGAKCKEMGGEMMTVEEMRRYAPNPMLKAAIEALVLRHPGHASQKTHGNRFGGYSTTKESLRRLKEDKGAREQYKATARKRSDISNIAKQSEKAKSWEDVKKIPNIKSVFDKAEARLDEIDTELSKFSSGYAQSEAGKKHYDTLIKEKVKLHRGVRSIYQQSKRLNPNNTPFSKYAIATSYRLTTGEKLDV